MFDFVNIVAKANKDGSYDVYPEFVVMDKPKDLMIRGRDFYAAWDEENKLWTRSEGFVIKTIDAALKEKKDAIVSAGNPARCKYMRNSSSGSIDKWHKYVQKQMRDCFELLDQKIIFASDARKRSDNASRFLSYPIEKGSIKAYDKIMSTLYDSEEREKLEWATGAVISGDAKKIQKCMVLYGAPGTGKSTFLNILQELFDGYWSSFSAKAIGSSNSAFALESFKNDPLIAIEHEANLSKISDNALFNSVISHETIEVNEKFKAKYQKKFNTFLFMGTNKEVAITDGKAGLLRRVIVVMPSGRLIPESEYDQLTEQIKFELGGIAEHCLSVYRNLGPKYYSGYIPTFMLATTNQFYDFLGEYYDELKKTDPISLNMVWGYYKQYCAAANIQNPLQRLELKTELTNYYKKWDLRGSAGRNTFSGFMTEKFDYQPIHKEKTKKKLSWLIFDEQPSLFDERVKDLGYKAQYATKAGTPKTKWSETTTTLEDIDTTKEHYVKLPKQEIVLDFDKKNEQGEKDYQLNYEAASKFPPTYAELSRSGVAIHLHYIYDGDVSRLAKIYGNDPDIEIKVFNGNASLRRKLTKCNNIPIATISSGLPLKGEKKKVIDYKTDMDQEKLIKLINKTLNKEVHDHTKPSVDFIYKLLEDAYNSGMTYDVSVLYRQVYNFALQSTHQSEYCLGLVKKMHFRSEEEPASVEASDELPIIFLDVEVFPNLFLVNYKQRGPDRPIIRLINPEWEEIKHIINNYRIIGFNNRKYDNHILYARANGYSNELLYKLSKNIIDGLDKSTFGSAYNLSYADIYDFSAKKQSLKKWEIELGIHHQELGLPWDQPVPEDKWGLVSEYCDNDVRATEAVFEHLKEDFNARKILAALSGLTVNDTTRMHATKFIFGDDRTPALEYTDLSTIFPGYEFNARNGTSTYMGEDPSEGGYVYAEPGVYGDVALLDIQSLHPTSAVLLNYFGPYTPRFKELLDARLAVKHHDVKTAEKMLGGILKPFLGTDKEMDDLAYALKIVINSVYGYTSATFPNPFRDERNKDNIVAKRGALFMITLKNEVQKKGFTVAHIKTDSIKIPDATPEIISFVKEFGLKYGYVFEHEATYDKMCLVNDAVYIAKYKDGNHKFKLSTGQKLQTPWVAVGAQFQHPYVFKDLFSKHPIEFDDLCETKTVTSALYLDMNEGLDSEEHRYTFVGRAGRFCPIKDGHGGGLLLREKDGKYNAATGSKGYRWLESEVVKELRNEGDIDESYFQSLSEAAQEAIQKYTDFDWFVSDTPYQGELPFQSNKEELPWNE